MNKAALNVKVCLGYVIGLTALQVFAEYQPKIGAVQLYVPRSSNNVDVRIRKDGFKVNGQWFPVAWPMVPERTVAVGSKGCVHLRLNVQLDLDELAKPAKATRSQVGPEQCSRCRQHLFPAKFKFTRIAQMPSSQWYGARLPCSLFNSDQPQV